MQWYNANSVFRKEIFVRKRANFSHRNISFDAIDKQSYVTFTPFYVRYIQKTKATTATWNVYIFLSTYGRQAVLRTANSCRLMTESQNRYKVRNVLLLRAISKIIRSHAFNNSHLKISYVITKYMLLFFNTI